MLSVFRRESNSRIVQHPNTSVILLWLGLFFVWVCVPYCVSISEEDSAPVWYSAVVCLLIICVFVSGSWMLSVKRRSQAHLLWLCLSALGAVILLCLKSSSVELRRESTGDFVKRNANVYLVVFVIALATILVAVVWGLVR